MYETADQEIQDVVHTMFDIDASVSVNTLTIHDETNTQGIELFEKRERTTKKKEQRKGEDSTLNYSVMAAMADELDMLHGDCTEDLDSSNCSAPMGMGSF